MGKGRANLTTNQTSMGQVQLGSKLNISSAFCAKCRQPPLRCDCIGEDYLHRMGEANRAMSPEQRARDFEMMLNRISYRYSKGLPLDKTIAGAADLVRRAGTSTPFRETI